MRAALCTNTHLAELYASGHPMDASTAACFADMLATNATLRSLCRRRRLATPASPLAPGVARSASLAALDLENKGAGDAGGEARRRARHRVPLRAHPLPKPSPAPAGSPRCAPAPPRRTTRRPATGRTRADGDAPAALAALLASPCPLTILDLDRVRASSTPTVPPSSARVSRDAARAAARPMPLLDGVILDAGVVAPAAMSPPSPPRPSRSCVRCLCVGVAWAPPARARRRRHRVHRDASTGREYRRGRRGGFAGGGARTRRRSHAGREPERRRRRRGRRAGPRSDDTSRVSFGNEAIGDAGLAADGGGGAGGAAGRRCTSTREDAPRKSGSWRCARRSSRARTSSRSSRRWWWVAIRGRRATRGNPRWVGCGREAGVDVAWRAADAGDSKEEREAGERLLAQHREQQAGLPPPTP